MSRSPHAEAGSDKKREFALVAAIICACLAFFGQLLGAWFSGSLALLSDTAHVFTDLFSLILSYVAIRLARKQTTAERSYGWFRAEVLASFCNGLLLLFVAIFLLWESVERLMNPQPIASLPVLVAAAAGLFLNLLAAWFLQREAKHGATMHSHGHAHGHSHSHTCQHDHSHTHDILSPDRNLHAAYIHVLSDAAGSVAVVIGAIAIHYTALYWLDTLIAILLAFLITYWAWNILRDSVNVLLEATPKHIQPKKVESAILAMDTNILKVDDLHIWEITSQMYAATLQLTIAAEPLLKATEISGRVEKLMLDKFGIAHATIGIKAG